LLVVQSAGKGFRLNAQMMKQEFNRAGPVLHLLLRYTQALITQMAQTAVCNRHHSLDQQLCRWLLLSLDRLEGNQLVMTQELIANMLGVRREGVTAGALKLQHAGLIQYARGHITVLDRAGLEKRSCECYAVVKDPSAQGSGSGGAGIVSQVPPYIFAPPQSPEFPYAEVFHAPPRMSAAQLDALQKRRYPVVIERTWRLVFDDEPAPETPAQKTVGSFTPAAQHFGPTHGMSISTTAAMGALTLTDANGVDVTALHRA
jgi:hypothetical protein